MPDKPKLADDLTEDLEDIYQAAAQEWGQSNPARLEQLRAHLTTAAMVIGHLATETPYTTPGA